MKIAGFPTENRTSRLINTALACSVWSMIVYNLWFNCKLVGLYHYFHICINISRSLVKRWGMAVSPFEMELTQRFPNKARWTVRGIICAVQLTQLSNSLVQPLMPVSSTTYAVFLIIMNRYQGVCYVFGFNNPNIFRKHIVLSVCK